jgi:hypothetical protein
MRRNGFVSLLAVSMLVVGVSGASAQFKFGPRAAFGTDFDFAIGAAATLGFTPVLFEGTGPLQGALSFEYYLDCSNCSFFEISPTVFVPFSSASSGPYAGAGLNFARWSVNEDIDSPGVDTSSSDVGLALQGGYLFPLGGQTAMADARFSIGGSEQLVLSFTYFFTGSN